VVLLAALLGPTLTGCGSLRKRDAEDPLVGPGPKGLQKTDPGTATKTHSPVPPVPAANSASSNADLAAGAQLAGGRPLGIDGRGAGGWVPSGPDGRPVRPVSDSAVVPASGGVILSRPEPLGEGPQASAGGLTPVPVYGSQPGAQPAAPPNADQLIEQLKARGAVLLPQSVTRDGVSVRCAVADPANRDRQHIYEATGPDAASALQALLNQIDRAR
jgi:hypothetical protein